MKKILCIILCLTMIFTVFSGCGQKSGPLSDEIDINLWQEENPSDIMSLPHYLSGLVEFRKMGSSDDTVAMKFKWDAENYSALEDYIKLLCDKYNFEKSGEIYYEKIWDTTFFDMVLRYTGEKNIQRDLEKGVFSENLGDLLIRGTLDKYDRLEAVISYSSALIADDDGYRYNNPVRVTTQAGESAGAGLEYKKGAYRTTDGRLSTPINKATFLTNGVLNEYNARYEINKDKGAFIVYVENEYDDEIQSFYVPTLTGWHDGFYTAYEFSNGLRFSTIHNQKTVEPELAFTGEISGIGFRVMYKDEKVMVFYTCTEFRSEPTVTEALIAVRIDVDPVSKKEQSFSGGANNNKCNSCTGSGRCTHCRGSGNERNLVAGTTEYLIQDCSHCLGSGKCQYCNGSGKK